MALTLNLRAQAGVLLGKLLSHQGSLSSLLPTALNQIDARDRPLLQEICYGTCRQSPRLSVLAALMLRKPFHENDHDIQGLLLSALYQLDQLSTPDHAVINETVEAAKQLDKPWAAKLLNAVLRRYQRENTDLYDQAEAHPAYRLNHPGWFISKLRNNWPEHWEAVLQANDQPPPMSLRVNIQKISRTDYLDLLSDAGITAKPGDWAPESIYLETPCGVDKLPHFDLGYVSVQDEAAQLAAHILGVQKGDLLLDACAAPGGKLCHLLEMHTDVRADAVEIDDRRTVRITENLQRLNLNANIISGDAAETSWWDGELYDRILLDAPCSATGVIRRNPDIKLLRRNEDIVGLAILQLRILNNIWAMLKPSGKLLYATCSIFPQENERIIERFLKLQPDAIHQKIDATWGEERSFGRQLFATEAGPDGFYYALLSRRVGAS